MERTQNIFFNVVKSENTMTELFCNFLRFKTFRDAVLGLFVKKDKLVSINFHHCETQPSLPGNKGTPDLRIINEEFDILFEFKIRNSELTPNQPIAYLEYLMSQPHKNKWLVFLVPKDYRYLDDLRANFKAFTSKHAKAEIHIKIIFWQEIIKSVEENEFSILNHSFHEFLYLMKHWFELESIKFNNAEVMLMFTKTVPDIVLKLYKIVDEVGRYASKNASIRLSRTSSEYGIYFRNSESNDILWFGVWYEFWEKHQKPLTYGVNTEKYSPCIIDKFTKLHANDFIDYKEDDGIWRMSCIEQKIFNRKDCIDIIAKTIECEVNHLIENTIK